MAKERAGKTRVPADVYLARLARGDQVTLVKKVFDAAGLDKCISQNDLVAVKMHLGEAGNPQVLSPLLVRAVVEKSREAGGKPFVTDANVLYRGERSNAVDHLLCAYAHGYTPAALGAPVIIADGLRGQSFVEAPVPGGRRCRSAKLAAAIYHADAVIALTHVTGHGMFGMAGAIKNLGMGAGSRGGKQMMHSDVKPTVQPAKCTGCRLCSRCCPVDATSYPKPAGKVVIDHSVCIGCGECVAVCPVEAIAINWGETVGAQERTAEFCAALMHGRREKFGFVSFLLDISGGCDCMDKPGAALAPDIGILASRDPVAIDAAAARLVADAPAMPGSRLAACKPGDDKFRALYADVDWQVQIRRCQQLGLGSPEYKLKEV